MWSFIYKVEVTGRQGRRVATNTTPVSFYKEGTQGSEDEVTCLRHTEISHLAGA